VLVNKEINTYLERHEKNDLLRFITCGSVDDGKSTLIGRLLYDSKTIFEDQLSALKSDSARFGTTGGDIDLALLVDGLQAEREQGITIDVAYRYFATDRRKFIIADTPGHEQFTRNMATGASTADLAVILIDARKGVQTQTRRHSYIASLLGIRNIIVAINKMDLVDYDQSVFNEICEEFQQFSSQLNIENISYIPITALHGDNVIHGGIKMPWYQGDTLITILENSVVDAVSSSFLRFPVQYVNRPDPDFRGYCGTVAAGAARVGDKIMVLPSRVKSRIKSIINYDGSHKEMGQGQAVTLTLEDEVDVSRGDMIVPVNAPPLMSDHLRIHLIWLNEKTLITGSEFLIKLASRTLNGSVSKIEHKINVNTLRKDETSTLALNEIGLCHLTLECAVAFDPYEQVRTTGSLILIDKLTNATVGAGMIIDAVEGEESRPGTRAEFEAELKALITRYYGHLN